MENKTKKMATFLHNTYEAMATEVGWKTQKDCRVAFDDLPIKNKMVMIKIAKALNLRLEKENSETYQRGYRLGIKKQIKDGDYTHITTPNIRTRKIRKDERERIIIKIMRLINGWFSKCSVEQAAILNKLKSQIKILKKGKGEVKS